MTRLPEGYDADACDVDAWSRDLGPSRPFSRYGWHCNTHDEDSTHTEHDSPATAIAAGRAMCPAKGC